MSATVTTDLKFPVENFISNALEKRAALGNLRKLSLSGVKADFSSNDYLGFAASGLLNRMVRDVENTMEAQNGSGGSRLLTGNSLFAEELELFLAKYFGTKAALIFNSGYDANIGLFSSLPQRGDTILYDEHIHASVHDGMRLSRADSFAFRHNDTHHLEERLKNARGNIFVAVETVYSMDGDKAPLKEIAALCREKSAHLIADEAHATGVFGKGLTEESGLGSKVFARIHTFGKALGCHGAVVVGSTKLRNYLINYARSFIYTTALPLHSLLTIRCALNLLDNSKDVVNKLHNNIHYFQENIPTHEPPLRGRGHSSLFTLHSPSLPLTPIQNLIVPGNDNVRQLAALLQSKDLDVRPIMSPTVPKGKERLRISLHSYNTEPEINKLIGFIHDYFS